MSRPSFSKKRHGQRVPTYPLGAKPRTGGSSRTKSPSRGRPRSWRKRSKSEQKRTTLGAIDNIFFSGEYDEEELREMGLVDLGAADWKDVEAGYDIYTSLSSIRSKNWEIYDLGYGSDTLWLVAVDKRRWQIVDPPEHSKVGSIEKARQRCLAEWDDIYDLLDEEGKL